MEIMPIASGSSGNAYRVTDGETPLLLDAGIPIRAIQIALDFRLRALGGCFITHCHGDHSKAARDLMRLGVDVYTGRGTVEACGLQGHRIHITTPLEQVQVGSWDVLPFDVQHDAPDSQGFLFTSRATGEKLLYFTDTYFIKYRFSGLTHIMAECNYSKEALQRSVAAGYISASMAPRLFRSHMSLEHLKDMLNANDLSNLQQIFLLHLSNNNSDEQQMKTEIERLTGVEVYVWHAFTAFRDFDDAMTAAGIMKKQYIIWWKPAPVLGHADYQWAHEPYFYAQKAGEQCRFFGDRAQRTTWKVVLRGRDGTATTLSGGVVLTDGQGGKVYLASTPPKGKKIRYIRLSEGRSVTLYPENKQTTVWEVARETKTEHPTQKPVEIPLTAITNSSETGDLVIDFFGGSGSTLIAAEMAGRRCYTMELDPKYCDVIVNRYVKMTGNLGVTLERDGEMLPYGPIKDKNDLDNGVE